MSGAPGKISCRAADSVHWVREQDFTRVVNAPHLEAHELRGLEEVLWDCLVLGYGPEQAEQAVAEVGMLDLQAARQEMGGILRKWQGMGLVELEVQHG